MKLHILNRNKTFDPFENYRIPENFFFKVIYLGHTNLPISRKAIHSHIKPIDIPKTHYWARHYPSERQDPAPSTRKQAQVYPTREPS